MHYLAFPHKRVVATWSICVLQGQAEERSKEGRGGGKVDGSEKGEGREGGGKGRGREGRPQDIRTSPEGYTQPCDCLYRPLVNAVTQAEISWPSGT